MAKQLFANNATSMLSGILTQGGNVLVCSNGEGNRFPSPAADEYFLLTIYTKDAYANEQKVEVVKVTSRVGDTLMIERDVELLTGQSGGYAYNGNTEQVYLELRWTAGGAGNVLQASDNLASLASALDARTNLGLGNVNNTADLDKPISNATQAALNGKADTGHTHEGFVSSTDPRLSDARPASDVSAWAKAATKPSYTKTDVGLGSVDNTSDANKPISTATQTALAGKSAVEHNHDTAYEAKNVNIQSHITSTSNPHGVTKSQVGLSNVDNTSDAAKPVSVAQQAALDLKAPLNSPALTGTASITANSTNPALKITQAGIGDALRVEDTSGDTTPFVIDASGNVGVGVSTAVVKLDIGATDNADEGAEVKLRGATNASVDWNFDVFQNAFRISTTDKGAGTSWQDRLSMSHDTGALVQTGSAPFAGISIRNVYGSGTVISHSYIDFQNENSIATGSIINVHNTDGSSRIDFAATAAGTRTSDRRSAVFQVYGNGNVFAVRPNGGLGYGTGAGGTVTQATSKSTAVTLNKPCGQITMHNAALAAGASVVFVVNNSLTTLNDLILINLSSGVSDAFNYKVETISGAAGTFRVKVTNLSAASLSEALILNFAVLKGSIA